MIIAKMMGAMGNQMFQYAFGKYLAKLCDTKLKLDLSFVNDSSPKSDFVYNSYQLNVFKLESDFYSEPVRTFPINEEPRQNVIEDFEIFIPKIHQKNHIYLNGFFQKTLYTDPIIDELRKDFEIKDPFVENSIHQELLEKIEGSNSVCVNFRRQFGSRPETIGNITNPGANNFHGIYGMEYFNQAIEILKSKHSNLKLFVFADDISWVYDNFYGINIPYTIVGHQYKGDRFAAYLKLMQSCKHFIIPNSTFAWWAAYLATHPDKTVITPKHWFQDLSINTDDLRPKDWLTI